MKDHSEFPTKTNYQAIAESLEAENKILNEQVELQTRRLETLQQGVRDANWKMQEYIDMVDMGEQVGAEFCLNILTEKTGISA